MLLHRRPRPVSERKASGRIAQAYHEIRQSLRVTGVDSRLRLWASHGEFFPMLWEAVRPNVETKAFEDASDRLRSEAVRAADRAGRAAARQHAGLGESQDFHVRGILKLFHYAEAKHLLLFSMIAQALDGDPATLVESGADGAAMIERGEPEEMLGMESIVEAPAPLAKLFESVQSLLDDPVVPSLVSCLALWPAYLETAWDRLKPLMEANGYCEDTVSLLKLSRTLALQLPHRVDLQKARLRGIGEDVDALMVTAEKFERTASCMAVNAAILALDWSSPQDLSASPFPAKTRVPLGS